MCRARYSFDDALELRRLERHVFLRCVRRLVSGKHVAAHEVLDAIDPHEDRVARIHAVASARVEVAGDREAVYVRALDERAQMLRANPFRLESFRALLHPVIHFG